MEVEQLPSAFHRHPACENGPPAYQTPCVPEVPCVQQASCVRERAISLGIVIFPTRWSTTLSLKVDLPNLGSSEVGRERESE